MIKILTVVWCAAEVCVCSSIADFLWGYLAPHHLVHLAHLKTLFATVLTWCVLPPIDVSLRSKAFVLICARALQSCELALISEARCRASRHVIHYLALVQSSLCFDFVFKFLFSERSLELFVLTELGAQLCNQKLLLIDRIVFLFKHLKRLFDIVFHRHLLLLQFLCCHLYDIEVALQLVNFFSLLK